MSPPEDKLEAAKRAEEEKMELERGEKLLDTSIDESSQDGKRNRVDSLSSHFIKVGLGSSEVFGPDASNPPPPPPARRHCPPLPPASPTPTAWLGQRVGT